jgi:hypothetical protein
MQIRQDYPRITSDQVTSSEYLALLSQVHKSTDKRIRVNFMPSWRGMILRGKSAQLASSAQLANLSGFDRTSESAIDGTDAQISRFRTELNIACVATVAQGRIADDLLAVEQDRWLMETVRNQLIRPRAHKFTSWRNCL